MSGNGVRAARDGRGRVFPGSCEHHQPLWAGQLRASPAPCQQLTAALYGHGCGHSRRRSRAVTAAATGNPAEFKSQFTLSTFSVSDLFFSLSLFYFFKISEANAFEVLFACSKLRFNYRTRLLRRFLFSLKQLVTFRHCVQNMVY